MTAIIDGRLVGTRREAAHLLHRHPDQIRRRCTPIGVDTTGRALYDLDDAEDAFADVPRRARLTRR